MQPGEVLPAGHSIRSSDGRYTFIYQGDGNLVLNGPAGPLWASNTAGRSVGAAIMQGDGNLVVHGSDTVEVWDSATANNPGSHLVVQDDGNVVIYRSDGAAVWATNTTVLPAPPTASGDDMQPGEVLPEGQSIRSSDGRYTFVYQGDGNLVLNGPAGPLWASNTAGRSVGAAIMQGDGNLVVHGSDSAEVWDSATANNPGSHLVVQDDGNVVIYRSDGAAVWATNTTVLPAPPTASGDDMQPGEVLPAGHSIRSSDGRYTFVYQGDGNLVLNGPAGPLWASNTAGRSVGAAIMQGDGNLVVHGSDSAEVWDSATANNPGSHLVVQDDGNVVIYRLRRRRRLGHQHHCATDPADGIRR